MSITATPVSQRVVLVFARSTETTNTFIVEKPNLGFSTGLEEHRLDSENLDPRLSVDGLPVPQDHLLRGEVGHDHQMASAS